MYLSVVLLIGLPIVLEFYGKQYAFSRLFSSLAAGSYIFFEAKFDNNMFAPAQHPISAPLKELCL